MLLLVLKRFLRLPLLDDGERSGWEVALAMFEGSLNATFHSDRSESC